MRVFYQGSITSEPFTDVYRNTLVMYSPVSTTLGKGKLQYTLDNSRLLQQGNATWVDFSSGTLSSTQTFVMPEYGAVRLISYADGNYIEIKEVIPQLGTSVLPSQVGQAAKILTTDGKVASWTDAVNGGATLPTQTSNANRTLTTDGSTASWGYGPIGNWVTPQGNTRQDLQDAIDLAITLNVGVVYMPPGTNYTFDDTQLSLNITNIAYANQSLCLYSPGRVVWDTSAFTTPKAALVWRGNNNGSGWHVIEGVSFTGDSTNSYGLEFQNSVGVRIRRCMFSVLAEGIRLYNRDSGDYTEDVVAEDCRFTSACGVKLRYLKVSGDNSFHGSGLRNCIINCSPTGPSGEIIIGLNCQPYNAPLDAQIFGNTGVASNVLISNVSTQNAYFYGQLKLEPTNSHAIVLASTASTGATYFTGNITAINKTFTRGSMRLIGGGMACTDTAGAPTFGKFDTYSIACSSSANTVTNSRCDGMSIVSIQLIGTNYRYSDVVMAGAHGAGSAGWTTLIHRHVVTDVAGNGPPVYTVDTNGALVITNANFASSDVVGYLDFLQFGQQAASSTPRINLASL